MYLVIERHAPSRDCPRLRTDNGCYWCCHHCDYNEHRCSGCGEILTHLGNETDGRPHPDCTA